MTERLSPRRQAIALLAGSLFDFLGPLVRRGVSELAPTVWAVCPDCGGDGVRRDRFRRETPCGTCGGLAASEGARARRGAGRVKVDPMDREQRPIGSVETPDAPPRVVTAVCDGCGGQGAHGNGRRCKVCDGAGRREWSPFRLRVDDQGGGEDAEAALLAAIVRRDEAGDYARLERALAELARVDGRDDTRLHRLWVGRYVFGSETTLSDVDLARLELAWRFIEARMPSPIRVPGDVRRNERARRRHLEGVKGRWMNGRSLRERDAEIRRRYDSGVATVEELVRTFGVSRSTVYEAIYAEGAA